MPWRISQRDGRFCVIKDDDNSTEACHETRAEAVRHMAALYSSEGGGKMLTFGLPIQVDEVKASADGWEVSGYASTYNNVDYGNDVVMPGAFDRTLSDGHKIRFLHSHDARLVLGVPKQLKSDKKGLFGKFKISRTTLGEDTRQLLQDGALDSFSIGYGAKEYDFTEQGNVRQLKEVELYEVSLVAMAMNPEAVVTDVKSWMIALGLETQGPTLAERAAQLSDALSKFIGDSRDLVSGIDRPLTQKKRQELENLLELCSGVGAVRSELENVLATAPSTRIVDAKRVRHELDSHRRRLAHILKE